MLRIHLTPDDLARVRIAPAPDPLAETILSLPVLQSRDRGGAGLDGWRERTRRALLPGMRPVLELAPARPDEYVPEAFLHAVTATLADSLDHTWSLARRQWTADLHATEVLRPDAPDWIRRLHAGEREWSGIVHSAVERYHAVAVAPYWSQLLAAAHADRTRRALAAADTGTGGLLASLHPEIRWDPPVLSVPCAFDTDLEPAGRGLDLVPTFFWPRPLALLDNAEPERPLVLRYPLARDLATYRAVWAAAAPPGRTARSPRCWAPPAPVRSRPRRLRPVRPSSRAAPAPPRPPRATTRRSCAPRACSPPNGTGPASATH